MVYMFFALHIVFPVIIFYLSFPPFPLLHLYYHRVPAQGWRGHTRNTKSHISFTSIAITITIIWKDPAALKALKHEAGRLLQDQQEAGGSP